MLSRVYDYPARGGETFPNRQSHAVVILELPTPEGPTPPTRGSRLGAKTSLVPRPYHAVMGMGGRPLRARCRGGWQSCNGASALKVHIE